MPDRPKRRKNNKNKRRNKNVRPDNSNNNSDAINVDINQSETCIEHNEYNPLEQHVSKIVLEETKLRQNENETQSKDSQNPDTIVKNSDSVVEDLNNNSNQVTNEAVLELTPENLDKLNATDSDVYIVESPEQSLNKSKTKLISMKSKSLDNDDTTSITEISDDSLSIETDNIALINSHNTSVPLVESDIEWEETHDLIEIIKPTSEEMAAGTLAIATLPFTMAKCDQNKSLTPAEENSLRSYLKTLNLSTKPEHMTNIEIKSEIEQIINQEIKQRLRKKGLADDFCVHRHGPSRILDVIDEEGSSESSMTSRRQSYLSEKKSDAEDLEDEVFEDNKIEVIKRTSVPCSSSHKTKTGYLVPQNRVLVGAKIKEPEVTEARGEWTTKFVEKVTGAEIVYLTDTSSSSSSLHEIGDDDDAVDTDVSVRLMTPTIEVTDAENFLKKSYICESDDIKESEAKEISQSNKILKSDENIQESNENIFSPVLEISDEVDQIPLISTKSIVDTDMKLNVNENDVEMVNKNDIIFNTNLSEKLIKDPPPNKGEENQEQNLHEIVVLCTDNIKTNLYVKDIDATKQIQLTSQNVDKIRIPQAKTQINQSEHDLESKLLKCEFNDAINNLIKEVKIDSEETNECHKDILTRQDSSSSVDSSQCTAKYNPNYESLNDISNIVNDEICKGNTEKVSLTTNHVKDVVECVTGSTNRFVSQINTDAQQPLCLRELCVQNIASLPYGDKILEELASVSKSLQNFTSEGTTHTILKNKDYINSTPSHLLSEVSFSEPITLPAKLKTPVPPPIQPRQSSLKKSHIDDHLSIISTKSEPTYVCVSPSQKMLMEKLNTIITKEDAYNVVDMHGKDVGRRRHNEIDKELEEGLPIMPFKSQTGSRLLALIRDPSLTRNINSLNDRLNQSLDDLQINPSTFKTLTKNTETELNYTKFANFSFKPIPPPRPKKYSNTFYESDESSEFTDNTMRLTKSERKRFHYSTGNLNEEIEEDVSSIQNMHRYILDRKNVLQRDKGPRRPSLPKDLCEQQMEYIRKKEEEVEAEIKRLEALKNAVSPGVRKYFKAPMVSDKEVASDNRKDFSNHTIWHKKDVAKSMQNHDAKKGKMSSLFSSSQEELLREQMYSEYVSQMAEREERKQHKVIKITNSPSIISSKMFKSLSALNNAPDTKVNNRIEKEFISKARERWDKLGIKDPETEDERECNTDIYKEPKVIEHKIKVIEGGKEKDVKKLPNHLQEFVRFAAKDEEQYAVNSGESKAGPASPPFMIMCAVIIIVIAVGRYFLRLLRYNN